MVRTVSSRIRPPIKEANLFYKTPEWRALTERVKREAHYCCEACGADYSHRKRKLIGDHIIEIKDGGAKLDRTNIQCLCIDCHNKKTAKVRAERSKG
jgi:5-methylcytosine-specific restriction endonuclease McrA